MLVEHMSKGNPFASFRDVLGIPYDTLFMWLEIHPEFEEARAKGFKKYLEFEKKLFLSEKKK